MGSRTLLKVAALALVGCCVACAESNFRLAPESRLPRFLSLPPNLKRSDVSVAIDYYSSSVKFRLYGPGGRLLQSVSGSDRWDPETERRGFSEYPTYSHVKVGDIEEIIEHRTPGDVLYIAERVPSDAERMQLLKEELKTRLSGNSYSFEEVADIALRAQEYQALLDLTMRWIAKLEGCSCDNDRHASHTYRGLAELRTGKRDAAKADLLDAARVKGSPTLGSFGPNMELAKELLEAGERRVVLDYFDLCAKFWSPKQLATWRDQVVKGETPDFGPNLHYF